jgi:protoporphyrinogen oxidase
MTQKAFVIGGGVTGLACAYKLSKAGFDVTLFESETKAGGLAKNFGSDGWHFELGPHNIHTQNELVLDFLKAELGDDLKERVVNTLLYFHGQKVSYPLKGLDVLTNLEPGKMLLTGWDFFITRLRAFLFGIQETKHFDEWIIRRFGKRLFNIYFAPYVRKVWKIDPHELSNYVGVSRIPVLSIRELILKQIGLDSVKKAHPEEEAFNISYLPVHGAGKITDHFTEEAKKFGVDFLFNTNVKKILLRENKVVEIHAASQREGSTKEDIYPVSPEDLIISTIPINRLVEMISPGTPKINNMSDKLDYTALALFYLKIKGKPVFNRSWVYFSKEQLIFNRITEHAHDDVKMVPPGHVSLCVELPCNYEDSVWNMNEDELFKIIIEKINEYQPLSEDSIVGYFKKEVRYAYPRFRVNFLDHLSTVFEYLHSIPNFFTLGRQGLFCYANIDQCINMSFDLCETIVNQPQNTNKIYRKIYENSFPQKIACEC